ncbi:hypothetical protein A9Q99_19360 [Gammaproteobacteria bacterium 45_16_T64]|nr:hypothetical protein A9Q99_19360 [Gammaproteobacteria bacterium 45_16_T64]
MQTLSMQPPSVSSPFQKISNALQLSLNPEGFFRKKLYRYDGAFFLSMPGLNQILMATSSEGASEIFSSPSSVLTSSLPSPLQPLLGSFSLILLQGAAHNRERRMIRPAFQGACLRSYIPLIHRAVDSTLGKHALDKQVNVQCLMQELTLDVIIEVVFGVTDVERKVAYQDAVRKLLATFTPPLMLLPFMRTPMLGLGPWDRFTKARAVFDTLILEDIDNAKRKSRADDTSGATQPSDVLSTLINLQDEQGQYLSNTHIRDELTTLLAAGHETTANSLTWAIQLISTHPSVESRLVEELMTLDENASIEQVMKLRYLDAVIKEVLRVHPVVPLVMRSVMSDTTLMGYDVAAGTYAGIATYALHMNPDIWTYPEEFQPQRFLDNDYSPQEYVPFGGGTKKCLGYGFALFEMKSVLFKLYRHSSITLTSNSKISAAIQGITLGPKQKITVSLSPR